MDEKASKSSYRLVVEHYTIKIPQKTRTRGTLVLFSSSRPMHFSFLFSSEYLRRALYANLDQQSTFRQETKISCRFKAYLAFYSHVDIVCTRVISTKTCFCSMSEGQRQDKLLRIGSGILPLQLSI